MDEWDIVMEIFDIELPYKVKENEMANASLHLMTLDLSIFQIASTNIILFVLF